jgi:hypothetical protein
MLTYYYALIRDPCERTARELFQYVEAHPGCLLVLDPDDSAALHRAIDITSPDYERRYCGGGRADA